jgi:DNA (cytosine-5)-methyltransferase 1
MDRLTKEQRRKNMQAIKSKNSRIERILSNEIWKRGYRYRKNYSRILGKPDICFPSLKIAVFCDSEFWHGKEWNKNKKSIKTNKKFWVTKIENNIERDKKVTQNLINEGWTVIRLWGSKIKQKPKECGDIIEKTILEKKKMIKYSEIKKRYNIDRLEKIKKDTNGFDSLALLTHRLQNIDLENNLNIYKGMRKYIDKKENMQIPEENNCSGIKWDIPFPPVKNYKFTFIDLFAGIGGFRIAFQNLGGRCVFSSEIDKYCKITYENNFGEVPFGDIKKINEKDIPAHDILLAGFPCQAFSIAGKKGGFEDTRGTLFFDIARIIKAKKPKAFFLENVKGLTHHNRGKTLNTILNVLRNDLNYYVPDPEILNAKNFGVPQNRERIFIIGFRKDLRIDMFEYPKYLKKEKKLKDIIEKKPVSVKYYLSQRYLDTLKEHKERHVKKGNGFGFEIRDHNGIANAIVIGGMGKERNLLKDNRLKDLTPVTKIKGEVNKEGIRRMTPREWARLQGYPEKFIIKVSDVQAYKQFANSVAIPAIQKTGEKILERLPVN